jgi:hypothetical protein
LKWKEIYKIGFRTVPALREVPFKEKPNLICEIRFQEKNVF